MIEPLRLIGWVLFAVSIPLVKMSYDRVVEQEESETPDLDVWLKNKTAGRAGVFFFLAGLVLIVNGGQL